MHQIGYFCFFSDTLCIKTKPKKFRLFSVLLDFAPKGLDYMDKLELQHVRQHEIFSRQALQVIWTPLGVWKAFFSPLLLPLSNSHLVFVFVAADYTGVFAGPLGDGPAIT